MLLLYSCSTIALKNTVENKKVIEPKAKTLSTIVKKNKPTKPKKNGIKKKVSTFFNQFKKQKTNHLHVDKTNAYCKKIKSGVTIFSRTLVTPQECIRNFGPRGKFLLRKNTNRSMHPIKVTIKNDSDTSWIASLNNVNLKTIPSKYVLKRLHYKTKFRAFLTGALLLASAGFILTLAIPAIPLVVFPIIGVPEVFCSILSYPVVIFLPEAVTAVAVPVAIGASASMIAGAPLASAHHSMSLQEKNQKITNQVKKITAKNNIAIEPHTQETFFLFVRNRNYKRNFSLTLTNDTGQTLSFNGTNQPV